MLIFLIFCLIFKNEVLKVSSYALNTTIPWDSDKQASKQINKQTNKKIQSKFIKSFLGLAFNLKRKICIQSVSTRKNYLN